ncbi:30S ribosomal protein S19e [Candidatus Woesearchaeota archaeon]|nr:30S ribosomal protein S19e [Candidatus Woesearchaeota archaeon]MBW2994533.1 30S ribosomal protein S19e [Candidatus Woesearchaeota archaeon]
MTLYDVPINDLILKTASELEKMSDMTPPIWAEFVKTGVHKERAPVQNNWWHIRAAAVLQTVSRKGPIGVSKLRVKYGGKKNRGSRPEKFFRASGNILRKILQQLEKAGLATKAEKGVHKGRVITPAGAKLLGKVANEIMKEKKITIPQKSKEELPVEYPIKKKKVKKKTAKKKTRKKATKKRAKKKTAKKAVKAKKPKIEKTTEKAKKPKAETPVKEEKPKAETTAPKKESLKSANDI